MKPAASPPATVSSAEASRSRAARSGPFQRPSEASGHSAHQRSTPWWQLHEVRSAICVAGNVPAGVPPTTRPTVVTSKPRSGASAPVAELLVVAVKLSVGGDDGQARRAVGEARAGQAGQDPLPRKRVGVHRRVGLERSRRRQRGVVEDDGDRLPTAEIHTVRAASVEAGVCGLPRGQDGVADALVGQNAQRRQVHGRLWQPDARWSPTESQLEVAQAPADLGPTVRERSERQDGVVVCLGHGVAAVRVVQAIRQIRVDETLVRGGILGRQPARQSGPQVVRDVAQVAALGVRPVALGVDPCVPVAVRGRRRLGRNLAAERIAALRLVEMAVDGKLGSTHSADGSGAASGGHSLSRRMVDCLGDVETDREGGAPARGE